MERLDMGISCSEGSDNEPSSGLRLRQRAPFRSTQSADFPSLRPQAPAVTWQGSPAGPAYDRPRRRALGGYFNS